MKIFDINSYYFSASIDNIKSIEEKTPSNKKECKIIKFETVEERKRKELTEKIVLTTKSF